MAGFIDRAAELVALGEARHFSEAGWINRAALKSLFIDLDSAAKKVPHDIRERYPEVPWRELSGVRNLLAHGYESVQDRILWNTAVRQLPAMGAVLERAADEIEGNLA
ncbi:hypothetical protein D477_011081 [Arthrobacter crystallopoietes BAB-32]|uniref:DUF86 domain-containing protein n=1 Tax=Arthrobacter crystallopoietes BAB-32 TaxID=1246476 RepID=N1UUQ3_9MICC|nr:HepT-like ribonuclease domain-containing protein [Arthrobacter crystallopoietes]EMY34151.1 hypothetical protein D477_011081 [Arthrobacter crystallopoietes BAB-32]